MIQFMYLSNFQRRPRSRLSTARIKVMKTTSKSLRTTCSFYRTNTVLLILYFLINPIITIVIKPMFKYSFHHNLSSTVKCLQGYVVGLNNNLNTISYVIALLLYMLMQLLLTTNL